MAMQRHLAFSSGAGPATRRRAAAAAAPAAAAARCRAAPPRRWCRLAVRATLSPDFSAHAATERLMYDALRPPPPPAAADAAAAAPLPSTPK
jgi:hypothetical protein